MTLREQLDAHSKAIYDQWVFEAVMSCAIKMPWPHDVEIVCGYNPQLLLTDQRTLTDRVCDLLHDGWRDEPPIYNWPAVDIDNEMIDFGSIPPGTPSAPMVRYAVVGTGHMIFHHVNEMRAVVPRWGESDTDPLADIEAFYERLTKTEGEGKTDQVLDRYVAVLHADFSEIEMRALLAMVAHESRPVVLDLDPLGGMLPGMNDVLFNLSKEMAKSKVLPRRPDYHRHDPTKHHGTHKHTKRYTKRRNRR